MARALVANCRSIVDESAESQAGAVAFIQKNIKYIKQRPISRDGRTKPTKTSRLLSPRMMMTSKDNLPRHLLTKPISSARQARAEHQKKLPLQTSLSSADQRRKPRANNSARLFSKFYCRFRRRMACPEARGTGKCCWYNRRERKSIRDCYGSVLNTKRAIDICPLAPKQTHRWSGS